MTLTDVWFLSHQDYETKIVVEMLCTYDSCGQMLP